MFIGNFLEFFHIEILRTICQWKAVLQWYYKIIIISWWTTVPFYSWCSWQVARISECMCGPDKLRDNPHLISARRTRIGKKSADKHTLAFKKDPFFFFFFSFVSLVTRFLAVEGICVLGTWKIRNVKKMFLVPVIRILWEGRAT